MATLQEKKQIEKRNRALKKAECSRTRNRDRLAKTYWHEDHFSATVEAHHAQQRQKEEDKLEFRREMLELSKKFDAHIARTFDRTFLFFRKKIINKI